MARPICAGGVEESVGDRFPAGAQIRLWRGEDPANRGDHLAVQLQGPNPVELTLVERASGGHQVDDEQRLAEP
jgi:hypothetical protein